MCRKAHPANEHQCGVNRCNKGKGKLYVHVITQCANCQSNHQASFVRCSLQLKVQTQACKNKAARIFEPPEKIRSAMSKIRKEESFAASDLDMDVEGKEWAKGLMKEPS